MKWVTTKSKKRLTWIAIALVLYGVAIFVKLVSVQIIQYDELSTKAKENWDREIPFHTQRGEITDRNNEVIVTNKLAPTLYFMPSQNEDKEQAADAIANVLNKDRAKILERLQQRVSLVKLAPEAKNITYEEAEKIQQLQIPGLYSGVDYVRSYPHGNLLARFLGFTGADNQGLAGIEYEYDELLKSSDAAIRLFTDAKGNALEHVDDEWKDGKDGATIQLTIDLKLQKIVERELSQAMLEYDADQALAIAMNPNSGEILALASFPTYDPTKFSEVEPSIYNRNLPVFMSYEPGSTFKIITLSAAIEEGVVNMEEEHFHDHGYTMVEGARLRCWKREGHKDQTFYEVVQNSCNPGFVELGQRVGSTKLLEYIHKFGFGKKTGSNISGESTGILFSKEAFGPVEHATTSFGQGVSVTPIQQMQAVSAAINGGTLYTPYTVSKILDSKTNEVIMEQNPEAKVQVISEETSEKVRHALELVVAKGSGRQAFRDGLRIGGKTGTAQKVENGRYKDGDYIVSFIGFAPANDPEIIVYVAIDNPKSSLQFGSVIAAPIVGRIIEDAAPLYNIEKQKDQIERNYVWGDELTERTPNFIGMTKEEVIPHLYPYKIEWHGEGEKVIQQVPSADSLILQSGSVHLYLGN
ncbi:penicillin-binding transpeptidase domain-containing protein [Solibacillus isronensis]|uniref:penicillin-binding transpeptidase domain-containing protein n=1 Tax=Solibacillus isronensis TaxID=412383 RepID=UPI00203D55AE|nr:penicillin-binding transpeptidase domain-containing protein [Solibacillus isronensis]MCM3722299.1 penicillin-binding transpeptidase domain-containing protein [Solibacillus isronensis]